MSLLPEPDLPPHLASLKNVDTLLRCPICFDYLNISMMTKCSHNFCSLCIRKFLSYKLLCPVCNSATTELDLRNNRILDDLVKTFQAARQDLSQARFESPPISPKTPCTSIKTSAAKPETPKMMNGTILSHFFQKKQASATPERSKAQPPSKDTKAAAQGRLQELASVTVKEEPVEVSTTGAGQWSSSVPSSPSTSRDIKSTVKVECPVCSVGVPEQCINQHLDVCLIRDEKKESLRSAVNKRKPLTKLVYHLLSTQDLKKRLRDFHLSTKGSREELVRRHQEFVHMYNAQCDSLNPMSVEDIGKEIENNEKMRAQLDCKSKTAVVFSKTKSEEEIEEMHANYRKQHSAEFSRLISQVKGRLESSKKAQIKQEDREAGDESRHVRSADLNKEDLSGSQLCTLVTPLDEPTEEETSVISEVTARSPSPALSTVSSSSVTEGTPNRKRRALSPRREVQVPQVSLSKRSRRS
ncbi:E3 ubiquitin-protein ligase RAD18 isoform X2 [Scleropages formosus]|uniref:RING-type E3 ubiquitin transferase n=1 Tax=Scleropages formosus TaxID=113540 RepID=A0A8C9SBV1_SCLFO|nr:E3 ubiquitin-protein ligase RAD18 isoform X2 [Scleropages formosus]